MTSTDDRLRLDESRRAQQHEALRTDVEADLDRRLREQAQATSADAPGIERVATDLHRNTLREVEQSERELGALRTAARVTQVVDYLFFLLYALLGLRFLLALMGAANSAGFVRFVKGITQPFYAPFKGIVASPALAENGSTLALPILFALIVYGLLHVAIRRLLRVLVQRRTQL